MTAQHWAGWNLLLGWEMAALAAGLFAPALLVAALLVRRKAAPPLELEPPERRQEQRCRGRSVSVLATDAGGAGEAHRGYVTDYSAWGVGLILMTKVRAGVVLSLLPGGAPLAAPRVQAEVRYCRLQPGGWLLVGCRFREPPPDWVLAHFG
jgi:hypothetical protein